ncbi:MAG: hypothetical protein U9R26_06470 [Campylobacterota bacterium]|nr:hypothetical protein [Campylobacterota bacterium]
MASLGQIGKRLQIIKIAISITDDETVNLQRSKLRLHKNDKLLGNILSVLDDENYAQASNLIDRYINGPRSDSSPDGSKAEEDTHGIPIEIEQTKEKSAAREKEEEELIKKFGLFMDEASKDTYTPVSEEEMLSMTRSAAARTVPSEETADQQTLEPKQPTAEEILARYDTIGEEKLPPKESAPATSTAAPVQKNEYEKADDDSFEMEEVLTLEGNKEVEEDEEAEELQEDDDIDKPEAAAESPTADQTIEYAPISYIDQKIRNMLNQYPQVEESSEQFKNEERLLYMISLEGYTEADISKTIDEVFHLKKEGKLAEASHLLLIAAATESLYAQFILARELFRGDILQRDLPEAFTQINRLALDDYPEAVCDLAQFYERGIGIDKDKKKAFSLYEDALELGVERANTHLNRMEEESRGFIGKLFRR